MLFIVNVMFLYETGPVHQDLFNTVATDGLSGALALLRFHLILGSNSG